MCRRCSLIHADDTLKSFYEQTKDMTPEERGKKLECNESISHAHGESAQEGQTEVIPSTYYSQTCFGDRPPVYRDPICINTAL